MASRSVQLAEVEKLVRDANAIAGLFKRSILTQQLNAKGLDYACYTLKTSNPEFNINICGSDLLNKTHNGVGADADYVRWLFDNRDEITSIYKALAKDREFRGDGRYTYHRVQLSTQTPVDVNILLFPDDLKALRVILG
jgi:hypothetical protein